MKEDHINDKIENTLNSAELIDQVQASPFLKNKILNRIDQEQEAQQEVSSWLTPGLQLAALTLFVAINIAVFLKISEQQYSTEVDSFAAAYELAPESDETLFE